MRAAPDQPVWTLLSADRRKRGYAGTDAADRRGLSGIALLWCATDDAASASSGPSHWSPSRGPSDAQDGASAIFQKPNTSAPHPENRVYPYLLRSLAVVRPNQVWCSDITYIPMRRGFLYLVAIMDWHSRRVLSWRLSNTMDVGFCVEALQEALA
eukprot:gene29537-38093_t